ncbi:MULTISPECIES: LLM class flavin-dependent oxidoreductase [Shouchella]|uniref:LLM class flavin-dependent oxidoreductase n=1 Tax=Shouchella TaxID=2893057 RepID=UPI000922BC28|nr:MULTISPECIES: LLM class flavin-dependent oxidoreductase [Shouchella]MCM3311397.1 LLM class flavin-dependent oxidoreductase [Psychrobacillus sp. MER TA 17]MDO7285065.1 LLM class flavin-dependent oxidoreductase [Shouchella clausii]MDO7305067.1 LLM class flavin-dependent oxidoreductase [Shouchella clausii]PAF10108.1 LLM class flavin-dependent oxidoreductase [Shouchella clausii]SHL24970.1 FMNH2-dependent dimethyl sulfone monooxygenase [Shouchella rhizosphaerae]
MKYAIWGANLAGGFLRANIEQEADGGMDYNRKLVKIAEQCQVDSILFPVRFKGNIGGHLTDGGQLDPLTVISALASESKNIHFIAAVLPGFFHPATLAKLSSTIDIISNGRFHINLVSGWFKEEQEMFGLQWIDHDERYKRSAEYLEVLKGLWTEDDFSFKGNYYQISHATLTPKPIQKPYPAIYQGGNSSDAQEMAGRLSDIYFMNGAPIEELQEQMHNVSTVAAKHQRAVKFSVNAFVIARRTREEALKEYEMIIENADQSAISQFKNRKQTKGMWKNATTLSDFVANNEGFRTGLIGSYEEVAAKIQQLEAIGIDKVLLTFRQASQEVPLFFEHVAPLLKEKVSF